MEMASKEEETLINTNTEEDEDLPTLSPYALEALQEFLASQSKSDSDTQQQQPQQQDDSLPLLKEDWRMSQFWYSPQTAITVADEVSYLLSLFTDLDVPPSVACISCPTLFIYLKVYFVPFYFCLYLFMHQLSSFLFGIF